MTARRDQRGREADAGSEDAVLAVRQAAQHLGLLRGRQARLVARVQHDRGHVDADLVPRLAMQLERLDPSIRALHRAFHDRAAG